MSTIGQDVRAIVAELEVAAARAELAGGAFGDPVLIDAGGRLHRIARILARVARRVDRYAVAAVDSGKRDAGADTRRRRTPLPDHLGERDAELELVAKGRDGGLPDHFESPSSGRT